MVALTFLLSFVGGYIFSLLFFFGRRLPFLWRTILFILTALLTLACPLCIPIKFPVARCLIATTLVLFVIKSWDLYLHSAVAWRLKLSGISKFLGIVFTYIFIILSSVFFFIPVNEGVSFYANQIPSWIKLW